MAICLSSEYCSYYTYIIDSAIIAGNIYLQISHFLAEKRVPYNDIRNWLYFCVVPLKCHFLIKDMKRICVQTFFPALNIFDLVLDSSQ